MQVPILFEVERGVRLEVPDIYIGGKNFESCSIPFFFFVGNIIH